MPHFSSPPSSETARRWTALYLVCLGILMIVLDTTIVNIALPSIKADLSLSDASATWIVNAYIVTFGGFLLLGGRLGDLFGPRRAFLCGLVVFTLASLACGLANTELQLILSRSIQGLGGAVVSATSLSLIVRLFEEPTERPKAMAVYSFVCAAGGSIGVLLGGILTNTLSWNWIFLINLPVGAAVFAISMRLLPRDTARTENVSPDIAGATTVTASLVLAIFAVVESDKGRLTSSLTGTLAISAVTLMALFLIIESKTRAPLVPLALFRLRSVSVANTIALLWAAAAFAWTFLAALYLQFVLKFTPLQVGLTFLPSSLIMAAFSLGLSARLVIRFGMRLPLAMGLLLTAASLLLLGIAPLDGGFVPYVLPAMALNGIGGGIASTALFLSALTDVNARDSGLASGVIKTSFLMGGALGLAGLAKFATFYAERVTTSEVPPLVVLSTGYQAAFVAAAALVLVAAGLTHLLPRRLAAAGPTRAEEASS
jgi:EmrB/QacA subfamily drug resistance transporter